MELRFAPEEVETSIVILMLNMHNSDLLDHESAQFVGNEYYKSIYSVTFEVL